jgi:hypothetical protein
LLEDDGTLLCFVGDRRAHSKQKTPSSWRITLRFFNGTLVQQAAVEPVTYSGPGSITQDLEGNLQLKLYHTFEAVSELNREVENALGGHHLPIGKLIDDHHYFAFQATDMTGQVWSAKCFGLLDLISKASV